MLFAKILGYRDPRYNHENPSEQVKVRWIKWSYIKLHEFHKVTKSHEKLEKSYVKSHKRSWKVIKSYKKSLKVIKSLQKSLKVIKSGKIPWRVVKFQEEW